ncbi:RNA lariat debranching enzyme Dbr1 [Schizosaccharomyces japonicus yFS275]|uniref:RNA lariat debranching enzyme Dbr1 n=1 Tax=Schizosaccharomyces japonicus (strain yFS275 / FY16936) TaxID=402676 RepID=B6JXX1_SCHJY|nr:RNA lariat debranching enzyme Dbr1 [Schizosaccharomyces japonicus yFS275]EEB06389.1 RNA lariat debranching enzyme Dbr1 [Schizosaccharomyces japonicus yFS275]
MRVGVQGCCHGALDRLYQMAREKKVDLLIIGGDFQALRNLADYHAISMPDKYKQLGDFPSYYAGKRQAPILTIFVGGNHEASNYLDELPYGGWVAQKIYYMGRSSVINVGGLRIAGLSGIYKVNDYYKGRYEKLPYNYKTVKSIYHVREFDVFKLKCLQKPIDIAISHDWPRGIEQHGNVEALLRRKPFFRKEVERNDLGSPANEELLRHLKPRYWFAAHLHTYFSATVQHETLEKHDDELSGENSDLRKKTEFFALDKCLPRRKHFEVFEIDVPENESVTGPLMQYDPEWLAITRVLDKYQSQTVERVKLPDMEEIQRQIAAESNWVDEHIVKASKLGIPQNFVQTAPPHSRDVTDKQLPNTFVNPQTTEFRRLLGLESAPETEDSTKNTEEIELDLW